MYQGKKVACLIMAAGRGTRMGKGRAKQFREVGGKSVLERTLLTFANHPAIDDIIIVSSEEERLVCNSLGLSKGNGKLKAVVCGGETREDSVWNGLKVLSALRGDEEGAMDTKARDIVLIQDAARPFTSNELIDRVLLGVNEFGSAVPCVPVRDTIKQVEGDWIVKTLPRDTLLGAQTPQAFARGMLQKAMKKGRRKNFSATDDSSFIEEYIGTVHVVPGEIRNIKITTIEDMATAEMLAAASDNGFRPSASYFLTGTALPDSFNASDYIRQENVQPVPEKPAPSAPEPSETVLPRVGEGYDVHMLVPGRPLVLGGLTIPYEKGLAGHSDADVMTHAAMDALLGAAGLGDIGQLFPDKDPAYEGVYSLALLEVVRRLLKKNGYAVGNLDITLQAQEPKIVPYIPAIRRNYAKILRIPEEQISVKGTTTERLGFVGKGEGMAATAICMLIPLGEEETPKPVFTADPVPPDSGWTHLTF